MIAAQLGKDYERALSLLYESRMQGRPDICCYWFEKANAQIVAGRAQRAGLLATQAIRGGTNRVVVQRIIDETEIFYAISDQEWILDGAAVHISMIGFGAKGMSPDGKVLDGNTVPVIHANLTAAADSTAAHALKANANISFQGGIKRGSFDMPEANAIELLHDSGNPNHRPNSDVLVPYINGLDIARRPRHVWVVDFGDSDQQTAAGYAAPFAFLREHVFPERQSANQSEARERWWNHWCIRKTLNQKLAPLDRYIATIRVAKHRLFAWLSLPAYADCALIAFASADEYILGILHGRAHEVWALAQGTQLREKESGFRYTPTSCFETFPFPEPTAAQRDAIAAAAYELDILRSTWLNPPEWTREEVLTFPGSVDGPWARYVTEANAKGIGTVRYPRVVPADDAAAKKLAKRTLTNLYNERPTWLDLAHKRLDEAVFAAYGWPADFTDDDLLARLLALNLERAGAATAEPAAADPSDEPPKRNRRKKT
jgi:hypothetical protein